ncbi:hypothetical protein ACFL6I_12325 [candidate division KSB1 bacterium]
MKRAKNAFENEKGEVWYWYKHIYMLYVVDKKTNRMLKRWRDAEHIATYWYLDGRVCNQYKIPANLKNRAITALKGTDRNNNMDLKKVSHSKQANFQISDSKRIKSEKVYDSYPNS